MQLVIQAPWAQSARPELRATQVQPGRLVQSVRLVRKAAPVQQASQVQSASRAPRVLQVQKAPSVLQVRLARLESRELRARPVRRDH